MQQCPSGTTQLQYIWGTRHFILVKPERLLFLGLLLLMLRLLLLF
jgi:hypothetical protein